MFNCIKKITSTPYLPNLMPPWGEWLDENGYEIYITRIHVSYNINYQPAANGSRVRVNDGKLRLIDQLEF